MGECDTEKEQTWAIIVDHNPDLVGDGSVTVTKANIKRLFEFGWGRAYLAGFKSGKSIADYNRSTGNKFDFGAFPWMR